MTRTQRPDNECPKCGITFRGRHGVATHLGKRPAYCLDEEAKRAAAGTARDRIIRRASELAAAARSARRADRIGVLEG